MKDILTDRRSRSRVRLTSQPADDPPPPVCADGGHEWRPPPTVASTRPRRLTEKACGRCGQHRYQQRPLISMNTEAARRARLDELASRPQGLDPDSPEARRRYRWGWDLTAPVRHRDVAAA